MIASTRGTPNAYSLHRNDRFLLILSTVCLYRSSTSQSLKVSTSRWTQKSISSIMIASTNNREISIMDHITDVVELMEEVNSKMQELVGNLPSGGGKEFNLDERAAYKLFVDVDNRMLLIETGSATRTLDYYGGFEYIKDDHRAEIGGYTIYRAEDGYGEENSRVLECIEYWEEQQEEAA